MKWTEFPTTMDSKALQLVFDWWSGKPIDNTKRDEMVLEGFNLAGYGYLKFSAPRQDGNEGGFSAAPSHSKADIDQAFKCCLATQGFSEGEWEGAWEIILPLVIKFILSRLVKR